MLYIPVSSMQCTNLFGYGELIRACIASPFVVPSLRRDDQQVRAIWTEEHDRFYGYEK